MHVEGKRSYGGPNVTWDEVIKDLISFHLSENKS